MEQCDLLKLHVDFPTIVTDWGGQCRQGFQHHPSIGLALLWMPSPTQCGEGRAGYLEEQCC